MRNVLYHFSDSVVVHIETLNGDVVPTGENKFPVFDDKKSFNIEISSGKIAIDTVSLANVLNSYVFASPTAPLKGISVTIEKNRLKIKGQLHAKGDIPFETDGVLSPTPDGKIRLHTEKIKALHVSVKGLMGLFNVQIADFVKTGKIPGVTTDQNDLILDLSQILPPPHIEGKVTAVRLEGETLVQTFGHPDAKTRYLHFKNYMSYQGNQLRFGRLTMDDADMILIDMDPDDPFDFYLDHYKEQLAAGYTKITPNFGLRVYVKDFNKLHQRRRAQSPGKK